MSPEIRRIFYLLTPIERQMYHQIGGTVPRDIPPHICHWHEPERLHDRYAAERLQYQENKRRHLRRQIVRAA